MLDGVFKVKFVSSVFIWFYFLEIYYGVKFILYINFKFYNKYLAGYFDEYFLWIVWYSCCEFCFVCGWDW